MERPNVNDEKYKLSNDFECIKFHKDGYLADINKHTDQVDAEKKELIESVEALLILIDSRLSLIDSREVGKGKNHIWNRVVGNAQNLINKLKQS